MTLSPCLLSGNWSSEVALVSVRLPRRGSIVFVSNSSSKNVCGGDSLHHRVSPSEPRPACSLSITVFFEIRAQLWHAQMSPAPSHHPTGTRQGGLGNHTGADISATDFAKLLSRTQEFYVLDGLYGADLP